MIRDFGEKNRQSREVWPELARHLPASLFGREGHDAIFTGSPDANWERFHKEYPDAACIITVARVGLNHDRTRALFYMGWGCGPLCGHGQLHVVRKEGDEWIEQRVEIGPSWES